jgi:subtilisin family serine protease
MSLGWYPEQSEPDLEATVATLLQNLTSLGVVILASAGNDADTAPLYPAGFAQYSGWQGPAVVSVGARNPNLTRATFSNYGPWVKKLYPGVVITSTFPTTFNGSEEPEHIVPDPGGSQDLDPDDYSGGYGIWSGTSFAAAIASARAAALLAANSGSSLNDVTVGTAEPRGVALVNLVLQDGWPQ